MSVYYAIFFLLFNSIIALIAKSVICLNIKNIDFSVINAKSVILIKNKAMSAMINAKDIIRLVLNNKFFVKNVRDAIRNKIMCIIVINVKNVIEKLGRNIVNSVKNAI
jgi:hypothetical protein